jgi:uncharacterized membrane protein
MAWIRVLHILAVVALLGNLVMAPFWRKRLAAGSDARARMVADRGMRVADLLFTLPGWVVVLITGLFLAFRTGAFKHGWLHMSLALFVIWLLIWHLGALRARKAMTTEAESAAERGQASEELERQERQWTQWSYISALVVLLILILMVVRPF